MTTIRDLLHADRVFKLMATGLSFTDAASLGDASAAYLIEAWEINMACDCGECGGDEGTVVFFGPIGE